MRDTVAMVDYKMFVYNAARDNNLVTLKVSAIKNTPSPSRRGRFCWALRCGKNFIITLICDGWLPCSGHSATVPEWFEKFVIVGCCVPVGCWAATRYLMKARGIAHISSETILISLISFRFARALNQLMYYAQYRSCCTWSPGICPNVRSVDV